MKLSLLLSLFCFVLSVNAQRSGDEILGKWMKIPKKDLVIEVYKHQGEYKGKISWSKDKDEKKPAGFLILEKLRYNAEKGMWENGKIHDPITGSTYSATAKLDTEGTLQVYGYKGFKWLGTTKYFERVD